MPSLPIQLTQETQSPAILASTRHLDVARRLKALSTISSQLARLRNERQLLCEVVDLLHLYFESAQFVEVVVVDREEGLSTMYSKERGRELKTLECGGVDALPLDRRAEFAIPKIMPADAAHGPMVSVPLMAGTTLLGLLVVETVSGVLISQADVDAVAGVAGQVSTTLQHLRVARKMEESRRLQKDLQAARRIQRSLLPQLPPVINGFRVAAEYRPAFDVGGDFYDVVSSRTGQLTAVIGDGSGKGVSGAMLMSRCASEVRRLIRDAQPPAQLLAALNDSFAQAGCEESFVTATCLELDAARGLVTIANAGHVLPLLRRANGEVVAIGTASGPPVGMLPSQQYRDEAIRLEVGDVLVLMTDGILDALHSDTDSLGLNALIEIIAAPLLNIGALNARILDKVDDATHGTFADDVTLLTIEVTPRAV